MIFLKEIYKENISPKVIEEYEQYIKDGLIKVYNPIDEDGSENVLTPVWEIVELTEEELLERIAEAKERAERLFRGVSKAPTIDFCEIMKLMESEEESK